jgi:hypothetical protein
MNASLLWIYRGLTCGTDHNKSGKQPIQSAPKVRRVGYKCVVKNGKFKGNEIWRLWVPAIGRNNNQQ